MGKRGMGGWFGLQAVGVESSLDRMEDRERARVDARSHARRSGGIGR